MMSHNQIIIVGGGPVGALNACYMAKRGYKVDLYELRQVKLPLLAPGWNKEETKRKKIFQEAIVTAGGCRQSSHLHHNYRVSLKIGHMRLTDNAVGRSINLALSCRGIESLKHAGLSEKAINLGIPMHARMIHLLNGKVYPVPYGKSGQFLLSVDRMKLNKLLLTAASSNPNVSMHFNHKLISCNMEQPSAIFKRDDGSEVTVTGDFLFGCDGSYSSVRRMLQRGKLDYSQEYIEHGYKELSIPPTKNNQFAMDVEYLHIWPRHEFMLIALPNLDKSFTCTLFMPFSKYELLTDNAKVLEFFNQVFPDVVPLIGEEKLTSDFARLPPLSLVTVKCSPYHYGQTVALFGDAAHAVVPFFGQGLNASLEDVLVFDEILNSLNGDIGQALPRYSAVRSKDGHAIADLSKQNYIEMRSSVVSKWFLFRKKVDNLITFLMPSVFVPKYTMVAFTRTPYHRVIEISKRQEKIVNCCLGAAAIGIVGFSVFVIRNYNLQQLHISDRVESFWKFVASFIKK